VTLWDSLLLVTRRAFREPKQAAADLMRLDVPRKALGPAFVAVMIFSVIVTEPMLAMLPTEVFGEQVSPFARVGISIVFNFALVWVIWKTATGIGGQGSFDATLLVFVFVEAVLSAGIAVLMVMLLALPAVAGIGGLVFFGYWMYLIGVFFSEAHKFSSPLKAIGVVALAWAITYVAMIFILKLVLGVVGAAPNV